GDVVDRVGAAHRARERGAVEQITFHDLHRHTLEGAAIPAGAREHAHDGAERNQLAHDVGADEAGAAGDQKDLHRVLAIVAWAADALTAPAGSRAPLAAGPGTSAVGRGPPSGPGTTVGTTRAPTDSAGASAPHTPAEMTRSRARQLTARSASRAARSPTAASS